MTERDITDYERAYGDSQFETVQARFRKRMLLALLDRLQPRRVLEVGCGTDSIANHWTAAQRFVIVEPARTFANRARQDLGSRADVKVIEATLEQAGDLDERFDLILLSSLLHEIADCAAMMTAVRKFCDMSTIVHVNVPNARSFHRLMGLEMKLIDNISTPSELQIKLQQARIFTLDNLIELVEGSDFVVIESGDYFVKPFTHSQMQTLMATGFLTEQMLEGFWGMAKHLPGLGSEIFVNARIAG